MNTTYADIAKHFEQSDKAALGFRNGIQFRIEKLNDNEFMLQFLRDGDWRDEDYGNLEYIWRQVVRST